MENVENQWLTLKIVLFRFARREVDPFPCCGQPVELCGIERSPVEAVEQPVVYGIDESCKRCRIGTVEPITKTMQRPRIDYRQAVEQCQEMVAQFEPAAQERERPANASAGSCSSSRD